MNPYTKRSDRPSANFDLPTDMRSVYSVLAVVFAIMGMLIRRLPTDSPRMQLVVTFSFLALAAMFVGLAWLVPPVGG